MATNPYEIRRPVQQQADCRQPQEGQEQAFTPVLDAKQTRALADSFKLNKNRFNPQDIERIKQHAHYHNIPFYEGEFNIGEAVMQFGKGFASGFTTFEVGEHPDNEYENIARSLGHLAGFAPGIMAGPLRFLRAPAQLTNALSKVKSVPLYLFNIPMADSCIFSVIPRVLSPYVPPATFSNSISL